MSLEQRGRLLLFLLYNKGASPWLGEAPLLLCDRTLHSELPLPNRHLPLNNEEHN